MAFAQTVTILQPSFNGVSSSPVTIQATVQDANPISATQVFVDGAKMFQQAGGGVNTSLAMTSGVHRIAVQAMDSKQQVFKTSVFVTVTGTTANAAATAAAKSTGAMSIFDRIEEMTGWQTCGACGNTGGTGTMAHYSMNRGIGTPTEDGSSAEFAISGAAFKNGYWFIGQHPAPAHALKYLAYQFDIFVPAGSENAPQAIEFECQQRLNGWVYNFAWQAEYTGNVWRIFNYAARRWESTGLPLVRFTPGVWHHVLAEYHTDSAAHLVFHDALTVDGVRHAINLVHTAKNTGGSSTYFTNAFQLDLNRFGTPFRVYVDKMKVSLQ